MRKSNKLAITTTDHSPMVLPHGTVAENDEIANNRPQLSAFLNDAVSAGVREIHFEQDAEVCRVRKRENGQLDESRIDSPTLASDLITEIRGHNTNEHFYGEASFTQRFASGLCTMECSYYPTISGQNLSILIEATSQIAESLDQTSLNSKQIQSLRQLYSKKNTGITLLVGSETGLLQSLYYGLLGELNCVEKKIISIEHKNAKKLARINQLSLANEPDADLITRLATQHADCIFVDWCCSKQTGVMSHLISQYRSATVFMVADNCGQAIAQLTDCATNAKQLATNLQEIVHVKNARQVCPHCAHAYEINGKDMQWLEKHALSKLKEKSYMYATGCERCAFSGSVESQPLLSTYSVDDTLRDAIEFGSVSAITKFSEQIQGNQSVNKQLLKLVAQGKVSFEEYKSG